MRGKEKGDRSLPYELWVTRWFIHPADVYAASATSPKYASFAFTFSLDLRSSPTELPSRVHVISLSKPGRAHHQYTRTLLLSEF